jgi:hypothetical protein
MSGYRLLLSSVAAATAVGALAAQPVSAATGAGTNQWRVAKVLGSPNDSTYASYFDVTGRDDAWSWWTSSTRTGFTSFIEHWNGARWSPMKPPSGTAGIAGLAASSARNLWIFAVRPRVGRPPAEHVVIWNGGSWRYRPIPSWVIQFSRAGFFYVQPVVFGPDNVWAFSLGRYAAHFNGHTWAKRTQPAMAGQVSALSPTDIWATTFGPGRVHPLMHWDGTTWRLLAIPRPTNVPPKSSIYVTDLTATGPRDVWLARDIQIGSQGARTRTLLHWNGRRWHLVGLRLPTSYVNGMAQDGQGGLWLVTNGPAPHYAWYFDHLLRTGRWTRQAPPVAPGTSFGQIDFVPFNSSLTWVPGTRSAWAAGNLIPRHGTGIQGAIFSYRP